MSLPSSILVMPVERLLAIMVAFLVLGLTVSSAIAASDVMQGSVQSISKPSGCSCCSGNVSSYKNFKVQVLHGATPYLIVGQVLSKDIPDLEARLKNVKLVRPQYYSAYVRIGIVDNLTVEQIVVPLIVKTENGTYKGVLLSLRNSTGIYSVLAISIAPDEIYGVYVEKTLDGRVKDNGTMRILLSAKSVEKYSSVLPQSKLVIPLDKFMKVCTWTVNKICQKGFGSLWACGFCIAAPLGLVGRVVCFLVCWYLEDHYSDFIKQACEDGAQTICKRLVDAGLVIIE